MGQPTALLLFELSFLSLDLEYSFKSAINAPSDPAQKAAKVRP